jgi:hypothetical protein
LKNVLDHGPRVGIRRLRICGCHNTILFAGVSAGRRTRGWNPPSPRLWQCLEPSLDILFGRDPDSERKDTRDFGARRHRCAGCKSLDRVLGPEFVNRHIDQMERRMSRNEQTDWQTYRNGNLREVWNLEPLARHRAAKLGYRVHRSRRRKPRPLHHSEPTRPVARVARDAAVPENSPGRPSLMRNRKAAQGTSLHDGLKLLVPQGCKLVDPAGREAARSE